MKFNSQICTSVEQSKRLLAAGLKPETADMSYYILDDEPVLTIGMAKAYREIFKGGKIVKKQNADIIPAWSLHRLIELYKDVEDTSMWSLENVNYNRLIQCIGLAIKHGASIKEFKTMNEVDITINDKKYDIIKLERSRVNKCESCDRFEECYHYPDMKNLCDKENMGDVYYVRNKTHVEIYCRISPSRCDTAVFLFEN